MSATVDTSQLVENTSHYCTPSAASASFRDCDGTVPRTNATPVVREGDHNAPMSNFSFGGGKRRDGMLYSGTASWRSWEDDAEAPRGGRGVGNVVDLVGRPASGRALRGVGCYDSS